MSALEQWLAAVHKAWRRSGVESAMRVLGIAVYDLDATDPGWLERL